MEGGPFDDQNFNDYNNQPLPSLSSTLLSKNTDVHSIQVNFSDSCPVLHQWKSAFKWKYFRWKTSCRWCSAFSSSMRCSPTWVHWSRLRKWTVLQCIIRTFPLPTRPTWSRLEAPMECLNSAKKRTWCCCSRRIWIPRKSAMLLRPPARRTRRKRARTMGWRRRKPGMYLFYPLQLFHSRGTIQRQEILIKSV